MQTLLRGVRRVVESPFTMMLFYITLAIIKIWVILPWGRFFGEEGSIVYPILREQSFWEAMQFVPPHMSQYTLVQNVLVYLSTLVPFLYAPAFATYSALVVQLIPILLIVRFRQQLGLRPLYLYGLIFISVGTPQSHAVWASAASVLWQLPIATVLLLVLPEVERRWERYVLYGVLVICALSSFSVVFVMPLWLLRAYLQRHSREFLIRTGIVVLASILQIFVFLTASTERPLEFAPVGYPYVYVLKQIVQPVFGILLSQKVGELFRTYVNEPEIISLLPLIIVSAGITIYVHGRLLFSRNATIIWILGAILALTVGHYIGSLDNNLDMIFPGGGDRYFYATTVLLFMCIGIVAPERVLLRQFFVMAVVTSVLLGIPMAYEGPNWRHALTRATVLKEAEIAIWPEGWTMPNVALEDVE